MHDTYPNYVADYYKKAATGVIPGMRCKHCGAKRFQYVAFCDKCGHHEMEPIELGSEGTLTIFSPTGDTMPEFAEFSTIDGVKLSHMPADKRPATSEYVWGEVVLDDGPSVFCFVKGFGIMRNEDLEPALKTLPRRVHVDMREVAGNSIPVAELVD